MLLHKARLDTITDEPYYSIYPVWDALLETDKGKWLQTHMLGSPTFKQDWDYADMCWILSITGELSEEDALWFSIQWGNIALQRITEYV